MLPSFQLDQAIKQLVRKEWGLEFQPRSRWDQTKIEEGARLMRSALTHQPLGPYPLQAAVSALHAEAGNWQDTVRTQIVALYELLHTMQPTPVVRVNQAMAISYASSPQKALEVLRELSQDPTLAYYQRASSVRLVCDVI